MSKVSWSKEALDAVEQASYPWRMFLRSMLPVARGIVRDAVITSASGKTLSIGDFFGKVSKYASPARYFRPAPVRALEALSKSKLYVSVFKTGNKVALIVHKTPTIFGPPRTGSLPRMKVGSGLEEDVQGVLIDQPGPLFDPVRAPYLSKTLEDATGADFVMFEPSSLEVSDLRPVMKAAQEGWKDPDLQKWMRDRLSEPAPAASILQPHFPVRFPKFAEIRRAFRGKGRWKALRPGKATRAAGWASIGARAAEVLSVASFVSFLKGNNPGFIASALFRSPVLGLVIGTLVNLIHGRKMRRRLREAQRRATLAHEEQVEAARRERQLAHLRKWTDMARTLQAGRYGGLNRGRI